MLVGLVALSRMGSVRDIIGARLVLKIVADDQVRSLVMGLSRLGPWR